MGYFRERRNIELSTVEHFRTQIDANWSNVTTVKSFLQSYSEKLPIICVGLIAPNSRRLEIGSNTLDKEYVIRFDIFAKSIGQRNDLADFILDTAIEGWDYKEYSHKSGDAEVLDSITTGRINLWRVNSDVPLEFPENADEYDKFRHYIEVAVKKGQS